MAESPLRTWRRHRTGRRRHPAPPPYVEAKWESAGEPRRMPTARWLKGCAHEFDGPYGERYFWPRREYRAQVDEVLSHYPPGAQLLWGYHPAFQYGRGSVIDREQPYWPEAGERVALHAHHTPHRQTWWTDQTVMVLEVLMQPPRAPTRMLVVRPLSTR